MKIVHASIDENGHIKGGKAGDQKKEVCIREWYAKGWDLVLRHPSESIANKMSNCACLLAESHKVGYDQNERNTLFKELSKYSFSVSDYIKYGKDTETDCSAFMTACAICGGVKTLIYSGNAPTTSTMEKAFKDAGFIVLKENKYLVSPDYLQKGDILVKKGSHTVMCTESGARCGNIQDFYPKYTGLATTLSQALSEMGIDSSKSHRKEIYKANYSDVYNYTAKQNESMLQKLKQGKLVKE